ncbi:MAG: hypothetical protein WC788_04340 [Candidatus Paceibacterota bacterium]
MTKLKMFFILAIIVLITSGCLEKNGNNSTDSNHNNNTSIDINGIIHENTGNMTKANITPAKTRAPVKTAAKTKNNISSIRVYDFQEKDYPVVIICLKNIDRSWGNYSIGNVNDNANDPTHIFQPSSSIAIKFDDNIHTFYAEDIGTTLPYNEGVIIEVRKNCEKELIESVQ